MMTLFDRYQGPSREWIQASFPCILWNCLVMYLCQAQLWMDARDCSEFLYRVAFYAIFWLTRFTRNSITDWALKHPYWAWTWEYEMFLRTWYEQVLKYMYFIHLPTFSFRPSVTTHDLRHVLHILCPLRLISSGYPVFGTFSRPSSKSPPYFCQCDGCTQAYSSSVRRSGKFECRKLQWYRVASTKLLRYIFWVLIW